MSHSSDDNNTPYHRPTLPAYSPHSASVVVDEPAVIIDEEANMHHGPRSANRRGTLDRRLSHPLSEKGGPVSPSITTTTIPPAPPYSGPSSPSSPTAGYTSTSGDTYYDEFDDWKHRGWRGYHPKQDEEMSFLKKSRRPPARARPGSSSYLPYYRRRRGPPSGGWILRRCLGCIRYRWARYLVAMLLFALVGFVAFWQFTKHYELQLEFSFFSRNWVRQEVESIRPLKGCWDPQNVSPEYNMTQHLAPRRQLLTPGINLRYELACYDFASTVQPMADEPLRETIFHTYWRSDLAPFDDRQAATLYAYLATQNLAATKLILWTNGKEQLMTSNRLRELVQDWPDHIEVRQFEPGLLTKGTEVEDVLSQMGGIFDRRAWVDGDVVRLLALYQYGGVWIDMDLILTRDVQPLLESEWVMKWDCYDKQFFQLNGAVMRFEKHSPYLCETFHVMKTSPLPEPNSFDWGSHLYSKVHRRLLNANITPFQVVPWCFFDPRNCRTDIRFPDPFKRDPSSWAGRAWEGLGDFGRSGREIFEEKLGYVFGIHLHNQWAKPFPKGAWMDRLTIQHREKVQQLKDTIGSRRVNINASGSGHLRVNPNSSNNNNHNIRSNNNNTE